MVFRRILGTTGGRTLPGAAGDREILLFNDMLDDENDFVRQALLAEMEKSFVAYEKALFLHIGARYIDQRATGDLNDENFLETFVRVFGKF